MYENKRVLGLIPARGGSKGIKNKNTIDLCGKPLIAYTIEAAINSKLIDDVVVTTDSGHIADVALKYGAEVPFLRPAELATDTSKTVDAVMHAVKELNKTGREYECLVLLQPTQPLRTSKHIDDALKVFFTHGEKSLVSVCEVDDHPVLIRKIGETGELIPLLECNSTCRRQDMPKYYKVNGCIYINRIDQLSTDTSFNDNAVPYIMDKGCSVDIDEAVDLSIAQVMMNEYRELYE